MFAQWTSHTPHILLLDTAFSPPHPKCYQVILVYQYHGPQPDDLIDKQHHPEDKLEARGLHTKMTFSQYQQNGQHLSGGGGSRIVTVQTSYHQNNTLL